MSLERECDLLEWLQSFVRVLTKNEIHDSSDDWLSIEVSDNG